MSVMLSHPFAKVVASSSLMLAVVLGAGTATEGQTARTKTAPRKAATAPAQAPVDLNSASAEQLETLPGIGPAHAREIIAHRPYRSVDDLARVKGLGKARIDAIRTLVTATNPAPAPAPPPAATTAPAAPATKAEAPATKAVGTRSPARAPATKAEAPVTKAGGTRPPARKAASPVPGRKVNINTASKAELDALPGIGPVKAEGIIANRPFKSIEDIKRVKGIKDVEFGHIKDLITID